MRENKYIHKAPQSLAERLKFIGPSAIVTGSVVGSGSIVMTPLLGAAAGFTLLWWLLLSIWTKPIIQAEISRYIVVTKKTFLEAFAEIPGPKTNINGLYLTGQDIVTVGLAGALASGVLTSSVILKKNLFRKI